MALSDVIAHIDSEIAKLQQVKAMLGGVEAPKQSKRGRPKGSKNAAKPLQTAVPPSTDKSKRKLSPEGRKAIADAMKRRWAEKRKPATK